MNKGEFKGYEKYSQIIKRAKDQVAMIESAMVRDGKIPTVLWIFRAKNYLNMKDVQQVEVTPTVSGDVPNNSEEILDALPDAPAIDVENEVIEEN